MQETGGPKRCQIQYRVPNRHTTAKSRLGAQGAKDAKWQILNREIGARQIRAGKPASAKGIMGGVKCNHVVSFKAP